MQAPLPTPPEENFELMRIELGEALGAGDIDRALDLIENLPPQYLNTPDEDGETLLIWGLGLYNYKQEQAKIILALIEKLDPEQLGPPTNSEEFARLYGEELYATVPLYVATIQGHYPEATLALIKKLSHFGCLDQSNIPGENGYTPLYWAIEHGDKKAALALIKNLSLEQLSLLDNDQRTPLHAVLECNHPEIAPTLIKRLLPDQLNTQDYSGKTPLHWAAELGSIKSTLALIKKLPPDQLNPLDNDEKTPLQLAAYNSHPEVVAALITHMESSQLAASLSDPFLFRSVFKLPQIVSLLISKLSPEFLMENLQKLLRLAVEIPEPLIILSLAEKHLDMGSVSIPEEIRSSEVSTESIFRSLDFQRVQYRIVTQAANKIEAFAELLPPKLMYSVRERARLSQNICISLYQNPRLPTEMMNEILSYYPCTLQDILEKPFLKLWVVMQKTVIQLEEIKGTSEETRQFLLSGLRDFLEQLEIGKLSPSTLIEKLSKREEIDKLMQIALDKPLARIIDGFFEAVSWLAAARLTGNPHLTFPAAEAEDSESEASISTTSSQPG